MATYNITSTIETKEKVNEGEDKSSKEEKVITSHTEFGENEKNEREEKDEGDKLLGKASQERRDYDDDYSKLLQLKQEMVIKEKTKKPWENKRLNKCLQSIGRDKKLLILVIILFVVIVIGLIVIYRLHEEDMFYIYKGRHLVVNEKSLEFEISNQLNRKVLSGTLWKSRPRKKLPYECSREYGFSGDLCLHWKKLMKLSVVSKSWTDLNVTCYKVAWLRQRGDIEQQDCFDLKGSQWFGGGLTSGAGWPLNELSISEEPFFTGSSHQQKVFGEVLEKYWISSCGVGIFVDDSSEIKISINKLSVDNSNKSDDQFCLYSNSQFSNLEYTMCVAPNMTAIHEIVAPMVNHRPQPEHQNRTFVNFTTPFWSTRSFVKSEYNQDTLVKFANVISKFDHEILLVDHGWENPIGELSFDVNHFHNISKLIEILHALNFKVSFEVNTYIEPKSRFFEDANLMGYLVKDHDGDVPGLTRWGNVPLEKKERIDVGVLDLSPNATEWFKHRLEQFQSKYAIDSVHFSGGCVSSLPSQATYKYLPSDSNEYTRLHNELSSSLGPLIPVETGYMSQNLEIIIRMTRIKSTWEGIQSIIPTALELSLAGYNLFIPEAAGGSLQKELLTKELYIRWMQLNTFLPFMHFSIPPVEFDTEAVEIAFHISKFRKSVVTPVIQKFYESENNFQPLIKPVWWYSPQNDDAINCKDEFVVGSKLLVAPILRPGERNRDIFIPQGIWDDKLNDIYHIGPKWIYNYSVPLKKFAYFIKK